MHLLGDLRRGACTACGDGPCREAGAACRHACLRMYAARPPARLPCPQHLPEEAPQVPPEVDRLKRGIKSGGGIIERVHQEWHIY